ncbi:MAG: hypothetical protein Q9181_001598 [Wetmoreana brouardii]
MKSSIAAIVAVSFAGVVAGQGCAAKGTVQAGNPIHRPLNEVVTAGTPFTITWTNTTAGPVSLELLRGPSTNVVPIGCIAENIPNTGAFVYTFPTSLTPDVTHYGLRIIDDKTQEFQYSTQFGIRNDVVHQTSTSSSYAVTQGTSTSSSHAVIQASDGQVQASTGLSKSSNQVTTASLPATSAVSNSTTTSSTAVTSPSTNSSFVIVATTHIPIPVPSSGKPYSMVVIQPSKNMTVPASLKTSKTQSPTKVTASASASFSSASGTGSPIASATPGPGTASSSGAEKVLAGSMLVGLGAMAAFIL